MRKITIHTPIWNGGRPAVGIAEDKLTTNIVEIEIDYTNRFNERLYPTPFFIERESVLRYPVQLWKGHKLHWIPIKDLQCREPHKTN